MTPNKCEPVRSPWSVMIRTRRSRVKSPISGSRPPGYGWWSLRRLRRGAPARIACHVLGVVRTVRAVLETRRLERIAQSPPETRDHRGHPHRRHGTAVRRPLGVGGLGATPFRRDDGRQGPTDGVEGWKRTGPSGGAVSCREGHAEGGDGASAPCHGLGRTEAIARARGSLGCQRRDVPSEQALERSDPAVHARDDRTTPARLGVARPLLRASERHAESRAVARGHQSVHGAVLECP